MRLGDLPSNTALIMCDAVFNRDRPLTYVAHEEDGPQAVCDLDHGEAAELCNGRLVGLGHLFEWEPDLAFLKELEPGHYAWKRNGAWEIGRLDHGDTQ